jgi:F-type H+-transporting ATPase subunit a
MSGTLPLEIDIHPGEHPEWHAFGMAFNSDTIIATIVAGALVVILGFVLRSKLTQKSADDHVPSKLQIFWETIVDQVQTQVADNLGRVHPFVVPLAVGLFFFILFANWLEMIPTKLNEHHRELLVSPTADTNLTYAMAFFAIVGVWAYGIREKGVKGYFSHFLEPFPWLLPLNILEELIKPLTLALRLFGNIFAGGIMLALIAGLVSWKIGPAPVGGALAIVANVVWKLFDMAIGVIQAFIFSLLVVLYFGMAGAGHGGNDHTEGDELDDEHRTPELAA